MSASTPRITGRSLKLIARLLRSDTVGPPLRRAFSALVVDKKLQAVDFAAEGDPAPFYMPPPWPPNSPDQGNKGDDK